jgi:ion channel-forming bestrophin family protein
LKGNIAIKLNVFIPTGNQHSLTFFKHIISPYAFALKLQLLNETTQFALDENPHPQLPELNTATHLPNRIAENIRANVCDILITQ